LIDDNVTESRVHWSSSCTRSCASTWRWPRWCWAESMEH